MGARHACAGVALRNNEMDQVDTALAPFALGGRHVCQTGLFVGHVGAASFGRLQRNALRAKSAPILSRRWPRFDGDVAQTLVNDTLAGARLAGSPLPVYLGHSLGGGTERWLS